MSKSAEDSALAALLGLSDRELDRLARLDPRTALDALLMHGVRAWGADIVGWLQENMPDVCRPDPEMVEHERRAFGEKAAAQLEQRATPHIAAIVTVIQIQLEQAGLTVGPEAADLIAKAVQQWLREEHPYARLPIDDPRRRGFDECCEDVRRTFRRHALGHRDVVAHCRGASRRRPRTARRQRHVARRVSGTDPPEDEGEIDPSRSPGVVA